jgi:Fe-S cluster biogenesis protein NfuA
LAAPEGLYFTSSSSYYFKSELFLEAYVEHIKQAVEAALAKVRPLLQRDGGDIELVEVTDGIVKVRLTGACKGCPMSQMTLKQGVERFLLKEVPGLKEVQAV